MPTINAGKILIIDDIPEIRALISSLLEFEGFESIEAESGPEGISLLSQNDISLVLLDYMLPEMDGMEVLKIIRSKYSALDLPIIIVTAKGENDDIVESLDAGANDYITKPI